MLQTHQLVKSLTQDFFGFSLIIMGTFRLDAGKVFLRRDLIGKLVSEHNNSLEKIAADWGPPEGLVDSNYPPAPSRAAIYNWFSNGFPSKETGPSRYQLLAFCGQLDVDPLALFDYQKNGYFSKFAKLRVALQRGFGAVGALAPLLELYEPTADWPSDALSKRFWGKRWCVQEFDNQRDYKSTSYALLNVRYKQQTQGDPRAVHIAYRRWDTRHSDTMWRYYGTVIAIGEIIELYSEGSLHLKMHRFDNDVISFRTYFGGRPVEFRIASLHEFEFDYRFPFDDMSVVGFSW